MPKEEGTKRKKAKKDPNAPKKPLGMYMMFCKERRSALSEEHPGLSIAELGKLLGEEWRALTDKDKEHYRSLADADKARYEKEIAKYNP
uniref:Upstream activation factor subunit UAF30 n=1 Tax=Tetraselmis sp. GSL018 TaxID=582737 RepID=A0A061S2H2_9CHLO|mmetsp:Transcript_23885/g.56905  ORF Transcript_23885/g.56905 Transcript_23885/m.56905 type:complete len:89 (+) Transcript_23885:170-436(+)|eukprot:CAMPEP_0177608904 /NCGR_PEP_ID=MMETSP0419_2-20121207/18743_1 /TAXON_ID=582737 /ORGANISM="Tetraselmis sp., Strain GSL018" /LENGTH=88 /DNA_ID=CAMNT_0019103671 /DNA_START=122 /DNA_END=388 /DNA_ORIENTATION=-